MPSRGRRIAVALVVVALVLAAGRWSSSFFSDRLWEASLGPGVVQAGTRRALLTAALEVSVLVLALGWFVAQLGIAARIALPDRPPPERATAKIWPAQVPRWSLAVIALVLAVLLGSGAGRWLDEVLLTLDGIRFGVPAPLLGADLGVFVRQFPLWLDLQHRTTLLLTAALGAVILLHIAGDTIRIAERRLWIWPAARRQLAVLIGLLALTLGWFCALEPYRLAAGLRGPLLASEFQLHSFVSRIQVGLALTAALLSFLWWFRLRGSAVLAIWVLFGVGLLVGRGLPLHGDKATEDPAWRTSARALDSVAFQLGGLDAVPVSAASASGLPAVALRPTLWDDSLLALTASDSSSVSEPRRGWIMAAGRAQPVWLAVRESRGQAPELLALSDDRVSPSGAVLAWREGDTIPTPDLSAFRTLAPSSIVPQAPRIAVNPSGPGVPLDGWPRRFLLAWALQTPLAFSAPGTARLAWRLDPTARLRAVAPFAHWTPAQARILGGNLVWQSDGLLTSSLFPSSARVEWTGGRASMVRSSFLGIVTAATGQVRVFRRTPADSLAMAWARIARPLIEPPDSIPAGLRQQEVYPEELLLAQARVLEGAAWKVGRLEQVSATGVLPPPAPGGTERSVPFLQTATQVGALLVARRTPAGDSLRLILFDSLWTVESAATLNHRWELFPFQQAIRDSVQASGASYRPGPVRYALTADGVVAYQPAWAVTPSNRAQLALVNVAMGKGTGADRMSLGAGRNLVEAWKNFRGEPTPIATGSVAQIVLEQARRLVLHADSALQRGDFQEVRRTMAYLRDLLGQRQP